MKAEKFAIHVEESILQDMRRRIRDARWADDFGNADWRYGVELGWLRDIASYWSEEFDWRAQEDAMNRFDHFRVEIADVPIHFMHVRGKGPEPRPLICTHGWPWSFWDWQGVIGPLTDPAAHGSPEAPSFDLIIPSLPGFGFSCPLRTNGIDAKRIAELWAVLMSDVLGYATFGAVGGDIGAAVTGELAVANPELLDGVLLVTPALPGVAPLDVPDDMWGDDEAWMRERMARTLPTFTHIGVHAHVPQTLAYGLADSPVGTAAWIWERRREWSDCGGDLEGHFGRDSLCTLASIYWLTNTIGTSIRWYHAWAAGGGGQVAGDRRVGVPTGIAVFPGDVLMMPRAAAEAQSDLRRWSVLEKGGHFAPAEQPESVVNEVRAFFASLS